MHGIREPAPYTGLSSYRRSVDRIRSRWPAFAAQRVDRLRQGLFDAPVEKIAENILEDLLTAVLDWSLADVNLQVGRADVVLSALGIKRLVLEVKRPGSLIWHRPAIDRAVDQARRYAAEQHVEAVAVSDGNLFYAADLVGGGLRPRVAVLLDSTEPLEQLWWVSVHGIYRPCPEAAIDHPSLNAGDNQIEPPAGDDVRHPKYRLPARCFGYVGAGNDPHTWKLPYLLETGAPDVRRLPKAIQCILSNYRGARVDIPRDAVADVLVRLARAASLLRKLPCQCDPAADAYVEAHHALQQLGRLHDVGCCAT